MPVSRTGHYPHQSPIDAYGNGGFRFADMSHRGSIMCLPTGMFAWDATSPDRLDVATLQPALAADLGLEVFLLGTGEQRVPVPADLRDAFRARGVVIEAMGTGSAVRTYNVLLGDARTVGAALIAVERVA